MSQDQRVDARRRITINDVARECEVSRATVSLVLRDSNRVSEATKERVRKVMADIGYVYDRRAANLRAQRAMTIGLVATDVRNPYFAELTMAIERETAAAGYTLLLGYSHDDVSKQDKLLSAMAENRVDGLFLLPASGTTARDLARVLGDSAHVLFARRVSGHSADYVGTDNVRAGQLLADHLADQGVRSAAFLGGPKRSSARRERERGVLKQLEKRGVRADPAMSLTSEASTVGGVAATTELLASGPLPDAIVAYSDAVASGVIATLRRHGIEAGKDVAVAGFDDIPQAELEHPALTTVATFPERIGAEAARLLMARMEDPSADHRRTILRPELRVRASTTNWLARET